MPIDRRYPIGGEMSDVVRGIVGRLRVTALQQRYPSVAVLAALMLAVVAIVVQGYAINHLAGIAYPVWRPRR